MKQKRIPVPSQTGHIHLQKEFRFTIEELKMLNTATRHMVRNNLNDTEILMRYTKLQEKIHKKR